MRFIFEIYNSYYNEVHGTLTYDSDEQRYEIDVYDNEHLSATLRELGVGAHDGSLWVHGRVIPRLSQGIEVRVKELGLEAYDEFEFLLNSMGKCLNDWDYLRPLNDEAKNVCCNAC